MKKSLLSTILLCIIILVSCGNNATEQGKDPMNVKEYTLKNGLKVYLSVYKDAPRIQTFIPVRVGGKNDPSETTGLAHYFEHLMFKGTKQFGTSNYEAEEPLLNEIERLFEVYRKTTDEKDRKKIYHQIDSVSQEASKYMIPNEYDKLMSTIGAEGTNAYTSEDVTCYVENIPSNQIENWAKIQADRFKNAVIRGFHTELETVYEEKNMSLTRDMNKIYESILEALYPYHPYGKQTVLGTQENLKNPSITNIKNYFKQYYVANNIAICMSGDFDPDEVIKIIEKYFSDLPTNNNIPAVKTDPEKPMTANIKKEIFGNDAESFTIAWRAPAEKDIKMQEIASMAEMVLNNGTAGLIDLNVNQKQKVLDAGGGYWGLTDAGVFLLQAKPKQGQTLEQVKEILLVEVDKLKKGEFEDWLVTASANNTKLNLEKGLTNNQQRASWMVSCFVNNLSWKEYYVDGFDRISKITKQDIVEFANKYLDKYVEIYKRVGKDSNEKKIDKPQITPIQANRDAESKFLAEIKASNVKLIEPVFVDYKRDLSITDLKTNLPLMYKKNEENGTFELYYIFDMGSNSDKTIATAFNYLKYLGTSRYSPEDIKKEFYKLACDFNVGTGTDRVYVYLEGLSENMERAMELMENLLSDPKVNNDAFTNLVDDIVKKRADAKLNQNQIFHKLQNYTEYGKDNPSTFTLNNDELNKLTAQQLVDKIKEMKKYQHRIWYYGPLEQSKIANLVKKHHDTKDLLPPLQNKKFLKLQPTESAVYFAPYDANQIYMSMYSNKGEGFDINHYPLVSMYNEYFGGGMNSIVFQEMREARALAYSAIAYYYRPSKKDETYTYETFIATQNDKMDDAVKAFFEIINNMPVSEKAFEIAKNSLITSIRTSRTTKNNILWSYLRAIDLGIDIDLNKIVFEKAQNFTMNDVQKFQEQYIKNRTYSFAILGNPKTLDFKKMATYGKIEKLTLTDVFGY
jgi:predicted Zn-dependent peptidase